MEYAVQRATLVGVRSTGVVRLAILDADGTVRRSVSGAPSPRGAEDVDLFLGVAHRCGRLTADGYLVALLSNQGGVAGGYLTASDAEQAMIRTCELLAAGGGQVNYWDMAPDYNHLRKPKTGMVKSLVGALAARQLTVNWERSFVVGDGGWTPADTRPDGMRGEDWSNSDRLFAERLRTEYGTGPEFIHARDFFGWR